MHHLGVLEKIACYTIFSKPRDDDFENEDKLTGKKDRLKLLVNRFCAIQISLKNDLVTCSIPLAILLKRQLIAQNIASITPNRQRCRAAGNSYWFI